MAFTDAHWDKVVEALKMKMVENPSVVIQHGGMPSFEGILNLVRENWDILDDERQLDTYLAGAERARLEALRARQQAALDATNDEINNL